MRYHSFNSLSCGAAVLLGGPDWGRQQLGKNIESDAIFSDLLNTAVRVESIILVSIVLLLCQRLSMHSWVVVLGVCVIVH